MSIAKKDAESARVLADQKALEEKLARVGLKQDEIRQIQDAIAALQAQKDVMLAEKAKANQRMMTDYSDSDEELRSIYNNFRLTQQQLIQGIEDKAQRLKTIEQECARSEQQMGKLSEDLGKLQAQEADYQRKKQELLELGNRLGGAAAGGSANLLQTLDQAFASKRQELQTAKAAAHQLDAKWEAELTSLKEKESRLAADIESKLRTMEQCKQKRSHTRDTRERMGGDARFACRSLTFFLSLPLLRSFLRSFRSGARSSPSSSSWSRRLVSCSRSTTS